VCADLERDVAVERREHGRDADRLMLPSEREFLLVQAVDLGRLMERVKRIESTLVVIDTNNEWSLPGSTHGRLKDLSWPNSEVAEPLLLVSARGHDQIKLVTEPIPDP
jgi:hypothetical protein